jgi:hypothetical protein
MMNKSMQTYTYLKRYLNILIFEKQYLSILLILDD